MGKGRARKAMSFDVVIGGRLRAQRLAQRMSEEEFARKLGLTFQQVQNYECGACGISVSRLKKISEILGVPIAAWFPMTGCLRPRRRPDRSRTCARSNCCDRKATTRGSSSRMPAHCGF
jgi:transcriptional regulator with XRE-family HTH domain